MSDAIERLEAIEAALKPFADLAKGYDADLPDHYCIENMYPGLTLGDCRRALSALSLLSQVREEAEDMQDRLEQIQDVAGSDIDQTAALVAIGVIASNTGKQIAEGFGLLPTPQEKSDV